MKPSTVLKKARALIERGWCRNNWAQNVDGFAEHYKSAYAVCYCAGGAIRCVDGEHYLKSEIYLERVIPGRNIQKWNDKLKSAAPVLRGFDRAIKLAISEGK